MKLYRTRRYRGPRASPSDLQRVDAAVTTIDLDVPDDVVGIVPEPSGVTVELPTVSDASVDRLTAERAVKYRPPSAQQFPVVTYSQQYPGATCAEQCPLSTRAQQYPVATYADQWPLSTCPEQCPVMMAEVPCDRSPEVRCAQSLERVGVACPSPCDEVCEAESALEAVTECAAAAECPASMKNAICQTASTSSSYSRAGSLRTGSETETDFDELYSDQTDDICQVSRSAVIIITAVHQRHHHQQYKDLVLMNSSPGDKEASWMESNCLESWYAKVAKMSWILALK